MSESCCQRGTILESSLLMEEDIVLLLAQFTKPSEWASKGGKNMNAPALRPSKDALGPLISTSHALALCRPFPPETLFSSTLRFLDPLVGTASVVAIFSSCREFTQQEVSDENHPLSSSKKSLRGQLRVKDLIGLGARLPDDCPQDPAATSISDGDCDAREGESVAMNYKPSPLQVKLEKQRELARKGSLKNGSMGSPVNQQPKKNNVMARTRLVVPNKGYSSLDQSPDEKPLVALDTDSDDDFDMSRYSSSGYSSAEQINQDLNIQLLKDGYRLDEIPDDEDLDLIPPKSVNPTCMCCQATSSTACHIQ
ncbi:Protein FAM219A [Microtus ochrogaster]|uniref:Protein FAM219A n=1 Tax=Microtus ochrogaster TaxID=79684 RepID=A0A8J6KNI6_MICOH|nr:Protein FAM219A [Microtus ochrogaster]